MTDSKKDFSNRNELLQANSAIILQLQARLKAKRYRPTDADASKLGYINSLVGALKLQNEILKNADLDEIKAEIEKLKGQK